MTVFSSMQELLAIQQSDGPKNLGFFGTRNMGMTHQKLVEILSYAMVSTVRSIRSSSRAAGSARLAWILAAEQLCSCGLSSGSMLQQFSMRNARRPLQWPAATPPHVYP